MEIPKEIIANQKKIANLDSLENQIGLSSYDLALISINKITNKSKGFVHDSAKTTFLI